MDLLGEVRTVNDVAELPQWGVVGPVLLGQRFE